MFYLLHHMYTMLIKIKKLVGEKNSENLLDIFQMSDILLNTVYEFFIVSPNSPINLLLFVFYRLEKCQGLITKCNKIIIIQ